MPNCERYNGGTIQRAAIEEPQPKLGATAGDKTVQDFLGKPIDKDGRKLLQFRLEYRRFNGPQTL